MSTNIFSGEIYFEPKAAQTLSKAGQSNRWKQNPKRIEWFSWTASQQIYILLPAANKDTTLSAMLSMISESKQFQRNGTGWSDPKLFFSEYGNYFHNCSPGINDSREMTPTVLSWAVIIAQGWIILCHAQECCQRPAWSSWDLYFRLCLTCLCIASLVHWLVKMKYARPYSSKCLVCFLSIKQLSRCHSRMFTDTNLRWHFTALLDA